MEFAPPSLCSHLTQLLQGRPSDDELCTVCMDRPRDIRFHCGHSVCCAVCSAKLEQCPFCRESIVDAYGKLLLFVDEDSDDEISFGSTGPRCDLQSKCCSCIFGSIGIAACFVWSWAVLEMSGASTGGGWIHLQEEVLNFTIAVDAHQKPSEENWLAVRIMVMIMLPWFFFFIWFVDPCCLGFRGTLHENGEDESELRQDPRKRARRNWNRRG